jgi:hypothetical protein
MSDDKQVSAGSRMTGIYTVFSFLIPGLLCTGIDRLLRNFPGFINNVPWWFVLLVFACAFASSRTFVLITEKRASIFSLIRISFFIYAPAIGIMVFFLYKIPLYFIYVCVMLFLQWIISFVIFSRQREYLEFTKLIKKYPGRLIVTEIHNHALMIQQSYKSLDQLRKMTYILHCSLFVFVTFLLLVGLRLDLFSLLACLVSIGIGCIFGITITSCMDEYRFYIDGLRVDEKLKQKRFAHVIILLSLGLLLVLPLLKDNSVFSPGDIGKAVQWFLHLFPENKGNDVGIPEDYFKQDEIDFSELRQFMEEEGKKSPIIDLGFIIEILGLGIAVFLAAGFLIFLVIPLFTRRIPGIFRGKKPLKEFIKIIKRFFLIVRNVTGEVAGIILSFFKPRQKKYSPVPREKKKDPRLEPEKISRKKRVQKNRVLKAFLLFIKWGMKQKIIFHPSMCPGEYISTIIEKKPEKKDTFEFIANIFEEALFSDHIIQPVNIKRYEQEINTIIRE